VLVKPSRFSQSGQLFTPLWKPGSKLRSKVPTWATWFHKKCINDVCFVL